MLKRAMWMRQRLVLTLERSKMRRRSKSVSGSLTFRRVESAVLKDSEPAPPSIVARMTTAVEKPRPYCEVKGYIIPQVHFELHLPTENWTQRLLFEGCGGFCGA